MPTTVTPPQMGSPTVPLQAKDNAPAPNCPFPGPLGTIRGRRASKAGCCCPLWVPHPGHQPRATMPAQNGNCIMGDQSKCLKGNILADLTIQAEPLGTMSPNPDPPGEGWAVFVGGSAHDTSARPGSPLVNAVGTVRWKRGGWASQPLQPQRHVRR